MPILRTLKNYLKAYLAKGVMRFMSQNNKIVYMVLNCNSAKIAPKVILPATDYVVQQIKKHIEVKEYGRTAKGTYKDVPISVVSTGMGAPAAAMVLEALKRSNVSHIVRLDYCGGLQEDINVGDIVLCSEVICGDGTSLHYLDTKENYPKVAANSTLTSLLNEELEKNKVEFHKGPVWGHDALFREPLELLEKARDHGAIAIDMESSVVVALGELFNIPTASILIVTDKPSGKGLENEKISITPKIFQNLDRISDIVLDVLSSLNEK
ncbi:MAG: hypothetical protein HWN66_12300 [Candidatus Helarchaeota archaeon]|nr:hypothetical protein [Candidatus Helarchaeota archaeon]